MPSSSSGMPGPESLTLRYCPPDEVQPTLIVISPPGGVNFTAFESRLSTIWRTRIEAGRYDLTEEAVQLAHTVEECRHMMTLRARSKGQTFASLIDDEPPPR
jgi:hypothetical protein